MRKIIAIITENKKNNRIPKNTGFYRPLFLGGEISYQLGQKELICSEPVGLLNKQCFTFSYKENGETIATGWFGLNGYTGRAHVETVPAVTLHSFPALQKLLKTVRTFVYDTVDTMGTLCFNAYTEKAEKHSVKKTASGHVLFVPTPDTVEFTPQTVNVLEKKAARIQSSVVDRDYMRSSIAEVKTLSWARRGCWCTSKLGNRYWRKGGVCHRHI